MLSCQRLCTRIQNSSNIEHKSVFQNNRSPLCLVYVLDLLILFLTVNLGEKGQTMLAISWTVRSKQETCTEVTLEFVVVVKVVLKITWRKGQHLEKSYCTTLIQTVEAFKARTTFKTCNSKTVYIDLAILVSYQGLFNKERKKERKKQTNKQTNK